MTNPFSWHERRTDICLGDATDYAVDVVWTPGGGPAGIRCRRCSEPLVTLHHIDGEIPTQLLRDLVIATHHPHCDAKPVVVQVKPSRKTPDFSAYRRQHIERYDSGVSLCGKPYINLNRAPDCFSCLYSQERRRKRDEQRGSGEDQ